MENTPIKGRSIRPLLSLSKHWRVSCLLAFVVLLLSLPMVWIKGASYYVAEAVFQVSPTYQRNLSGDKELEFQSNSQYREFVNHLSKSLLRYDVLERALHNLKAAHVQVCLEAETERKCIERLQRTVYVYAIPDTYMVRVGLQASQKNVADPIVNAIMQVFIDTVRVEQIFGAQERVETLQAQHDKLEQEVDQFEHRRAELASKLGLTTFTENVTNPYDTLLLQAREKLTQATIERSTAEAALHAFQTQREVPTSFGRSVLEMRLQDNGLQALRNEVVKRSEELQRTMAGLQTDHPALQPASQELADINARLQERERAFEDMAMADIKARLNASVQQTRQVERELTQKVVQLESQVSTYAEHFREALQLTSDIHKRDQELNSIRDRLNFLSTERNAPGFVRLLTPALPADVPQGLGKTKLLLAALLGCTALALALPIGIDLLDRRILEVSDAEKAMGIAAAAWMVQVHDKATDILAKEQSKRLASTLMRNQSRGATGIFGFTSAKIGGGATAIVLDVACTLQQLGCRVLVVDANAMGLNSPLASHQRGLSEVLANQATAQEVITQQKHHDTLLSVVPFGQARDSGIQRIDLLRQAMKQWSTDYDLVLVDISPLLPSADAELVIDAIGQVFLVVEIQAVTKGDVVRARAQLTRQAPDAVGLIVNKVPLESGGAQLHAQVVETITHNRFGRFMSTSPLSLRIELLRLNLRKTWAHYFHRKKK